MPCDWKMWVRRELRRRWEVRPKINLNKTWCFLNFVVKIAFILFFPVPVCAMTASGVPGGTCVYINRFSSLCGWLAQRQGWRVKGWILPSEQVRSSRANSWPDGRQEMIILCISPCGTSRVLLHAVKCYDMEPPRFTSHPRGRCAADFYLP
jgi:hypothetical protein